MGYEPIVYCRWCGEELDVYQAWEDRFCCEECQQEKAKETADIQARAPK